MLNDERPLSALTGSELTKRRIMESAQYLFATRGFAETGVRDICALADVNQALVTRYFGSKLGLFEQVLEASFDARFFTDLEPAHFGKSLAEIFCTAPPEAAHVVPALIHAAGDSAARQAALAILKRSIIAPLEQWFGGAQAEERVAQVLAVVTGFYVYRLMLPLEPMQGGSTPVMRDWLARTLQGIVDQ